MTKSAFAKFFKDIERLFRGRNLVWQGIAVALTWFLVVSGFDWWVTTSVRDTFLHDIARLAGLIGFYIPIALPLSFLAISWLRRSKQLMTYGLLIAQAEITAGLLAAFYKAFTGRPGPIMQWSTTTVDTSQVFRFGFLEGGLFWGWPSSHITIAVAAAVLLMVLYKHNTIVKYLALSYAIYMALSVSVTFHWFSDGVAGVIFGSIIGLTIAKSHINKT